METTLLISGGGMINTITMFLRRNTKKKGGVDYDCWTLVESVRTARGPRQRIVATIGKLPGLDREERVSTGTLLKIINLIFPSSFIQIAKGYNTNFEGFDQRPTPRPASWN